jgi:hypothetical protein
MSQKDNTTASHFGARSTARELINGNNLNGREGDRDRRSFRCRS